MENVKIKIEKGESVDLNELEALVDNFDFSSSDHVDVTGVLLAILLQMYFDILAARRRRMAMLIHMLQHHEQKEREERRKQRNENPNIYCRIQGDNPMVMKILSGDEETTKEYLKVTPATLHKLVDFLKIQKYSGWHKEFEGVVFLYWLAVGGNYRIPAEGLGISRSTVFHICNRFLNRMEGLMKSMIQLPSGDQVTEIGKGFARLAGNKAFVHCAGAIDECFIKVAVSKQLSYSLNLRGIVDHEGRFISVFAGFPGPHHEARLYNDCALFREGTYPPSNYFVIGNGNFPCQQRPFAIMTPFRIPITEEKQMRFNECLSRGRVPADRAFGSMLERWRNVFEKGLDVDLTRGAKVVISCIIIHNICVGENDWGDGMFNSSITHKNFRNDQPGGIQHRNSLLADYF